MPNTRNQSNFSPPHWLYIYIYIYIYIWENRSILVLLLISVDWFKHSNTSGSGYNRILNWFGITIWRPNAIFYKNVTLSNMLHNKFNPYIFHTFSCYEFTIYRVFIVPNLKCINAIFTMSWQFQSMLVHRCSTGSVLKCASIIIQNSSQLKETLCDVSSGTIDHSLTQSHEAQVCLMMSTGITLGMGLANETTLQCNAISVWPVPQPEWLFCR